MKILVTGGAGFIGSAVVRLAVRRGHEVVNLDSLTYAANLDNVAPVSNSPLYSFVEADLRDRASLDRALDSHKPDAIMHLAAESHVDRSIDGPGDFIETNITGTYNLLEAARAYWTRQGKPDGFRFHHISTDEVFGSLGETGQFTEATPYDPRSPYSASKAASDHLVRAWRRTYGLPTVVTNCSNNYGPYHFPEKLIPLMILNALEGKALPVYGDGKQLAFTGESARRDNYVWHAARAFFDNGGRRLYVVRVVDATATQAGNPPFAAEVALVGTGVARLDGTLANAPILPGSVRLTNRETVVAGETLGSGNGAAATFDFTLANAPNAANVVIRWTSGGAAKSATIAGNTATGDGTPASTTIDRATGQIHLDATGAVPDDTTDILAAYQYVDAAIISDDGAGKFAGFATSSIDYDTGAVSLTFASATGAGTTWLAAYTQAKVYARFPGAAGNGTVTFAASWDSPAGSGVLRERSRFVFEDGRWLYVDGVGG